MEEEKINAILEDIHQRCMKSIATSSPLSSTPLGKGTNLSTSYMDYYNLHIGDLEKTLATRGSKELLRKRQFFVDIFCAFTVYVTAIDNVLEGVKDE